MKSAMNVAFIRILFFLKCVVIGLVVTAIMDQWGLQKDLVVLMFILSGLVVLLTFVDMYVHEFEKKTMWLLFLFLIPSITPIVYVMSRNKLLAKHSLNQKYTYS